MIYLRRLIQVHSATAGPVEFPDGNPIQQGGLNIPARNALACEAGGNVKILAYIDV